MEADWYTVARTAAASVGMILRRATPEEKLVKTGTIGEGGDETLEIDALAEQAVFDHLEGYASLGKRFTVISEERGEVEYGSRDVLVIVDPIDGSLNAKRGLPQHAVSIAVADGPTMADVFLGYIFDFGTGEQWTAERDRGLWLQSTKVVAPPAERRDSEGRLEVLGVESADPRLIRDAADGLAEAAHRLRAVGSIAISLSQVAAGRMDGMVTLKPSRAVDTAAGQLLVREGGGAVAFVGADDLTQVPLDTQGHFPLVVARSEAALEALRGIPPRG